MQRPGAGVIIRNLNLDDDSFIDHEVRVIRPHSILRSSINPDDVLVFGMGNTCAILSLKTSEVRYLNSSEGMVFSGHGLVVEGNVLWSCEGHPGGQIFARARNMSDLSLISEKNHEFEGSHHIVKLPGTSILVCAGYSVLKNRCYVNFYDYVKNELVQTFTTPYRAVHLLPLSSTEVVGVALATTQKIRNEDGELLDRITPAPNVYFNINGDSRGFWDEKQENLFRFGFGIVKSGPSNFITGHNNSNTIILWNDFKISKTVNVPQPWAMSTTKNGAQLIVHSGPNIHLYSLQTFELQKVITFPEKIVAIGSYQ